MRRLTRLVSFCLGVVLLQLLLVESGYACAMPAASSNAAASSIADMGMNGDSHSRTSGHGREEPGKSPCRFPWSPNGCQSMAPCAVAALVAVASTPAGCSPAAEVAFPLSRGALLSRTLAPEPPPPRA